MQKRSFKQTRIYRLARINRRSITSTSAVSGLWLLSLAAIATSGYTEERPARAIQMSSPVQVAAHRKSWITLSNHDGIAVVGKKRTTAPAGIVKRAGVQLTKNQASFVTGLGQYLKSQGEYAVVTSGARSPDHQLSIIKSKIKSMGASRKFPQLRRASVARTSTWLAAWEYLRARHVPVYAPASAGGEASASNHIKGLAVDLISGSLDHLKNLIMGFASSTFASRSALHVLSIAREPGCVHVNLK